MNLKPINSNLDTITFSRPNSFIKKEIARSIPTDPKGLIPNGIYGVIRWEKFRQYFTILASALLLITAITLLFLEKYTLHSGWLAYIPTIALLLCSAYKLFLTIAEMNYLKRSVDKYVVDLKVGLGSTPPFISKIYIGMVKKQVAHNWATFVLMFYIGIFTLVLFWLKDKHWWILNFKSWIESALGHPKLIVTLCSISLLSIGVLHVILAIQRKRKMLEIDSYFGSDIAPLSEIEELKAQRNKAYRRMFIISLLTFLIIPLALKIINKIIRRKL